LSRAPRNATSNLSVASPMRVSSVRPEPFAISQLLRFRVAGGVGRELLGAQHAADVVDHGGGVGVLVGVDVAGDFVDRGGVGCNGGHRRPVLLTGGQGFTHRPGRADKTEKGPLARLL
jgi:hypothetical protein